MTSVFFLLVIIFISNLFQMTAYFAERMISKEILQRNAVMQISAEKVNYWKCTIINHYYPIMKW